MKYLYVLTSTPKDTYYEEFLLSATSLRYIMADADITLLCDSQTKETLVGNRTEYIKLISNEMVINCPSSMPQIEVSRWLKTSMRRFVKGDFLYIDNDTIITEDLSEISKNINYFAACLDLNTSLDKHFNRDIFINNDIKLGFTSYKSNKHYNGGILFCKDTPETHKIFDRWHELWQFSKDKGIVRDQPSFNMAIYENIDFFTELDGIWNCQITHNHFPLPCFAYSKIIHYFSSTLSNHKSPFILASSNILNTIKEKSCIPDDILEMIKNPKAAFGIDTKIVYGDDMISVVNSRLFEAIYWIKKTKPKMFNRLNKLIFNIKKIAKSFYIKKSKKHDGGIKYYN